MTTFRLLKVRAAHAWYLAAVLVLSGCMAPALMFSPQGQLLWALLKPMVGLDPNEVNLFEQPLIKGRMQNLLGSHYDTAVSLLKTANEIQQEGPLFYLVSRHTPVPQLAEKAGFVWNAETNQMAVLLVSGGAPRIFAEQLNKQAEQVIPSWPKDLADYADPEKLRQKAINGVTEQVAPALSPELAGAIELAADPKAAIKAQQAELTEAAKAKLSPELGAAIDIASDPKAAVKARRQQLTEQALSPVQQQRNAAENKVIMAQKKVAEAKQRLADSELALKKISIDASDYISAQQNVWQAQQLLLQANLQLEKAEAEQKALETIPMI